MDSPSEFSAGKEGKVRLTKRRRGSRRSSASSSKDLSGTVLQAVAEGVFPAGGPIGAEKYCSAIESPPPHQVPLPSVNIIPERSRDSYLQKTLFGDRTPPPKTCTSEKSTPSISSASPPACSDALPSSACQVPTFPTPTSILASSHSPSSITEPVKPPTYENGRRTSPPTAKPQALLNVSLLSAALSRKEFQSSKEVGANSLPPTKVVDKLPMLDIYSTTHKGSVPSQPSFRKELNVPQGVIFEHPLPHKEATLLLPSPQPDPSCNIFSKKQQKHRNFDRKSDPHVPISVSSPINVISNAPPTSPETPLHEADCKISSLPKSSPKSLPQYDGVRKADSGRKSIFPDHLSAAEVSSGIKSGRLFRSSFRVNAYNRFEAYVTLEGLAIDVLIFGNTAQNRAIEGDIVAIEIDPHHVWPKVKGAKKGKEYNDLNGVQLKKFERLSLEEMEPETENANGFAAASAGGEGEQQQEVQAGVHIPNLSESEWGTPFNSEPDSFSEGSPLLSRFHCSQQSKDESRLRGGKVSSIGLNVGREAENGTEGRDEVGIGNKEEGKNVKASIVEAVLKDSSKRPSGRVVAILEPSQRRETLVGFLELQERKRDKKVKEDKEKKKKKGKEVSEGAGAFSNSSEEESSHISQLNWPFDGSVLFVPVDPRFSKMIVHVNGLPDNIKARFMENDPSLGTELIAARVDTWRTTSYLPHAILRQSLGQAGEIETETAAILFQYSIHTLEYPPAALACLPRTPWKIPSDVIRQRWDLRDRLIFSIDPPTARDLDDALSIELLPEGKFRVGVHIADVSYFVKQGTALDKEARRRSTSVYLIQRVLPMLPSLLCEKLCSLNPGADRLAFSVVWDMNSEGEVTSQWVGKTVIRSACKLSYGHAQEMIEGRFPLGEEKDGKDEGGRGTGKGRKLGRPTLHGAFTWADVNDTVLALNSIARKLRARRYANGAVKLDNCKLLFTLDADGNPVEVGHYKGKEANNLVEEFMLLANMSVARAISAAFPNAALLRRHPEPNARKLSELEAWLKKQSFEFDARSSGSIQESLLALQDKTSHDSALFEILLLATIKPMQLAKYFSTGELPGAVDEWGHYALATPFYTHFTSPIRRYPDLVVHRTLAAVLHAEELLHANKVKVIQITDGGAVPFPLNGTSSSISIQSVPVGYLGPTGTLQEVMNGKSQKGRHKQKGLKKKDHLGISDTGENMRSIEGSSRYFTGPEVNVCEEMPEEVKKAAAVAAKAYSLFESDELAEVAKYCNERKLASKSVQEACDKIYLCVLLKRCKGMFSDARVMGLGPQFMTVYVRRFGLERCIFYADMKGVQAEWFETTGTLVLDLIPDSKNDQVKSKKRSNRSKKQTTRGGGVEFADVFNRSEEASEELLALQMASMWPDEEGSEPDDDGLEGEEGSGPAEGGFSGDMGRETVVEPAVLPLTLQMFSQVPVLVYTVGGGNKPMDVAVKLHLASYTAFLKEEEEGAGSFTLYGG